jgi:hypothetical protein
LSQQYHVVVGNPPYIAVKDAAERERIKPWYVSCFKKWTLSVPFTERFFQLAQPASGSVGAGFVGLINSNSFIKREFGKKLIEQVLPSLDLTHVIDTSGCYIPGHGTPTVILFGRNQRPSAQRPVRVVQGIRGEPGRPEDAARGKVWTALVEHISRPGIETTWLSVADVDRRVFARHPWSLGGGGVGDLRQTIESRPRQQLSVHCESAGFITLTAEDEAFICPPRIRFKTLRNRTFGIGEDVRDWNCIPSLVTVFPYSDDLNISRLSSEEGQFFWPSRRVLQNRFFFGKYPHEAGIEWFEFFHLDRKRAAGTIIAFGEVATHNHFVLCRGGVVFKHSAPVIKLPAKATEDDHLALLACLNSSTAAFWFRQVCFPKGGDKMGDGARVTAEAFEERLTHNSTNIEKTPIPDALRIERIAYARRIDALGHELAAHHPVRLFASHAPTRQLLDQSAARVSAIRAEMIFWQEELDWLIYQAYGLLAEAECPLYPTGTVPLALGERSFEIDLARKVASDEEETNWFKRHRSTSITEIPAHWPVDYRQVVQRRLDLIASHPHIGLLEKSEHKRRWQSDPWEEVLQHGLHDWLCDHLEDRRWWQEATLDQPAQIISTTTLTDRVFRDATFAQVAALYRGNDHFDQHALILELITDEVVPALPVWRYTDEGLIKRTDWEKVWDLQRREDAGEKFEIPVPPRYTAKDFQKATYWNHRGKLDVPKERFISYPGCQSDGDPGLLIMWAGYDHAQHATALVSYYQWAKETAGWPHERLIPLLASLDQLVPWLKQWHNDLDPTHGQRLGDAYAEFLDGECHALGKTTKDLREWRPTVAPRKASAAQAATIDSGEPAKKRGRPKKVAQG